MLKKILVVMALMTAVPAMAADAAKEAKKEGKNPVVVMETSMGEVKIELFPKQAPESVRNFLEYVKSGFYNGTVFHRAIPGFMAQGGGMTPDLKPKETRAPIKNEADNGLKNDRGTIAMARTGDPNSATSQFFINVVNNEMLNRPKPDGFGYAVFGKVVSGMDVVDKIVTAPTGTKNMFRDVPVTTVLIKSAKVIQ
jgi:peptidyl-prolyl cis-trans isomerase A (cyclophilin A)